MKELRGEGLRRNKPTPNAARLKGVRIGHSVFTDAELIDRAEFWVDMRKTEDKPCTTE